MFPGKEITNTNIFENLLRLKAPTTMEEQNAIWDITSDLSEIESISDQSEDVKNDLLPIPNNYIRIGLLFTMKSI